jgi:hypothetical protein
MSEHRFTVAGCAAIATAGLMPTAFIVAGIEEVVLDLGVASRTVGVGASDFLLLIYGAVSIFVLIQLKHMLWERYSYRGLDPIIAVAIAWTVVNYGGSFALEWFYWITGRSASAAAEVVATAFWIVCIGVFGIIDAILGIMLLIQHRRFGIPLRVFAAFSLATGLCGVTVILSFFSLLLYPLACIALGVAFLRPEERLEFV